MVEVKVVVAVVLSTFFILSEAAVTVEVISGLSTDNTIECGKQDKIRCVVSPFPGTGGYMAWNTNSKPLTQCFDGSDNDCNSLSVDHYQFTSKPADETFNLTFNTVKLSDGSVEFICTDTITTDSVTPNVTVLPVISSTELVNTSANVIKVTTGCVYPPDDVTFKWMFYAENEDAANAKDYGGSHSVMTEDSSTCTVGDCGGSDVKLRSSTLELENTEKGGSYNFKVVITHAALSETVTKTIGPFELGATSAVSSTSTTTTTPTTTTTTPTTTTTTTTTTPATTTTTPTTTTTTPTTTTTTPTTTTTTPSTTTTTPTSTTTTPTTTTTTPTTTSISISTSTTSTQSSPRSSSNSTTTSSAVVPKPTTTTSSSNETTVIIVSSVVGGLFLIGIVITIVLMLLSQRRGHHPARNHRHCDRRQKRRHTHRYPSWQDHGQYNNTSYMEYTGMGTKMNPLYVPYRSAHRAEWNYYLGHPSTDHQIYTRNHQIYYGGYNSNVRLQTDMHSYKQRYYGGKGGNTLPNDENNYVTPDYELYW